MRLRLVFFPTVLSCSCRFLRALQQNRAQSRLLYLLDMEYCVLLLTLYFFPTSYNPSNLPTSRRTSTLKEQ